VTALCPICHEPLPDDDVCPDCGPISHQVRRRAYEELIARIPEGGEIREATVLFCDLGGYTAWNEEEEPEAVASVMDRIKRRAVRVLEEHGGIANQFVGDEIVGLFGVTSSHEDDPARAISAALELHDFVRKQEVLRADGARRPLELHTGIETGPVLVRVTDTPSGIFDVTGDTVITAARLRARAETGEIVIGPVTHEAASLNYDTVVLPAVQLKGKSHGIVAYRVLGRARTAHPIEASLARRGLTRYVGREHELERLREAWLRTCEGRAALITVEGPAGIGKSRLFYELRQYAAKARVGMTSALILHGRCSAYRAAPYEPFIAALRSQGEQLAGLSEVNAKVLSYLLAADGEAVERPLKDGELMRQAIVDAIGELLAKASEAQPVLIALEDFHDADEPSRAAVAHIFQRVSQRRVLMVINHRPLDAGGSFCGSEHHTLEPLDRDGTHAMACGLLAASSIDPTLTAYIHERTQGNPFFVEEICRALLESNALKLQFGFVAPTRPLDRSPSPKSVRSIVRSRIERLAARPKRALRLASTLGQEFTLDALTMLWTSPSGPPTAGRSSLPPADATDLPELLAELEQQRLLEGVREAAQPSYRFKHAITQEVAYDGLPRPERRWYHGLVAAWTENAFGSAQAQYETIAHHYGLSMNVAKAIDYAILSGDKAWQSFSLEQAAAHYAKAITLLGSLGKLTAEQKQRHLDASVSWARVGLYNPHADQLAALQTSHEFARELGDDRACCVCLNWLSWIEYALGHHQAALARSQEFLASAEQLGENGLIAQALANAGLSHAMATRYGDAVAQIELSIAKRGRATGTAYAYSLGYLAMIRADQGDFARASAALDEAWQIVKASARDTLQGPALIQRAFVQAWRGDWNACIASTRQAHAVANRIGGNYIRAMSLVLQGYALGMSSPIELYRARELMHQGITMLEASGVRLHLSWCCAALAELLAHAQDYARAREAAEFALDRVRDDDRLGEVCALRALALSALRADGDDRGAEALLQQALEVAARKDSPREAAHTQLVLAELHRARGDDRAAEQAAQQALRWFEHGALDFYARQARDLIDLE
jgi:class 3 adenylate cyclase